MCDLKELYGINSTSTQWMVDDNSFRSGHCHLWNIFSYFDSSQTCSYLENLIAEKVKNHLWSLCAGIKRVAFIIVFVQREFWVVSFSPNHSGCWRFLLYLTLASHFCVSSSFLWFLIVLWYYMGACPSVVARWNQAKSNATDGHYCAGQSLDKTQAAFEGTFSLNANGQDG